jgi:tryptophan synthase alpha subunit
VRLKIADGVVIGSAIIRQVTNPGEGRTPAQAAEEYARSVTED